MKKRPEVFTSERSRVCAWGADLLSQHFPPCFAKDDRVGVSISLGVSHSLYWLQL